MWRCGVILTGCRQSIMSMSTTKPRSNMRVFKVIFRLDFATPNFDMCDRAGAALRILHSSGDKFFANISESFQNRMVWGVTTGSDGRYSYHVQIDTQSANIL